MKPSRNPRRAYDAQGREMVPMDIRNAKENGATGILAECQRCLHEACLPITRFPHEAYVPDVSLRLVCSECGSREIRTIPDWSKRRTGPGS